MLLDIFDEKLFWKNVQPSLSDKVIARDKINLSGNGKIVKTELETAEVPSNCFSDIVKNLEIFKSSEYESFIDNIEDKTLRAILKYENHRHTRDAFYFTELEMKNIEKEIQNFNTKKAYQYRYSGQKY